MQEIPKSDPKIVIYNINGQKVKTLEITQSISGFTRIAGLATNETQR